MRTSIFSRAAVYASAVALTATVAAVHFAVQNWYAGQDIARLRAAQTALATERDYISGRADQLITAFGVKFEPGTRQILVQSVTEAALTQLPDRTSREAYLLVLGIESRFGSVRQNSPAGAVGMAQIMPRLGRELAVRCGLGAVTEGDLQRDLVSLYVGACHFRLLYEQFGGNAALAMASYNAGVGRVSSNRKLPEETAHYVARAAVILGSGK